MQAFFRYLMRFSAKSGIIEAPVAGDVTVLLHRMAEGESSARASLMEALYPELKRIAEIRMRLERPDHTLQATALVSELFLEMAHSQEISWRSRTHFLAVASQAMRRFLIDYARAHNADRRGGGVARLQLDGIDIKQEDCSDIVVIGDLLDKLASEEPRMAQVVDMRCFGGLTYAEIGAVLEIDERTAKRDWQVARAWLQAHLKTRG